MTPRSLAQSAPPRRALHAGVDRRSLRDRNAAPDSSKRRAALALSLTSTATMALISAYQLRLLPHLPDPPLPGFDSESVVTSPRAFSFLGIPDGLLGLASYATTATLAAAGGPDRAHRHPLLPLSFAAKSLFDTANALRLTWAEVFKRRALCSYCLLATACTVATLPLAFPEARHALRTLTRRHHAL